MKTDDKGKSAENIRSEEITRLLEEKPSIWIRYGTMLLIIIFIILFLCVLSMPYPSNKEKSIFNHIVESTNLYQ